MQVNNNPNNTTTFNAKYLVTGSNVEKGRKNLEALKAFLFAGGEDMNKVHVEEIKNPFSHVLMTAQDTDIYQKGIQDIDAIPHSSFDETYMRKIAFLRDFAKGAKKVGDKEITDIQKGTKDIFEKL